MKKVLKTLILAQLVCLLIFAGMLIADKVTLGNDLIRLHVVAASDSESDQALKLQVRDAVVARAQQILAGVDDPQCAYRILTDHLSDFADAGNSVLKAAGSTDQAQVTLQQEAFPVRHYDTFSLPSGVYRSLRVKIGQAEGENWWCVVFPSLCMNATSAPVTELAVSAGFSDSLTHTLTGEDRYEISFFLLDCFGKLENLFFS